VELAIALQKVEGKMRIAICDDSMEYVVHGKSILQAVAAKNGVDIELLTYSRGEQLLFAQEDRSTRADLIFLDINMPGMNGIDTARHLRKMKCQCEIIFCTHSEEHMLEAFDVGAMNYIVKEHTSLQRLESIFMHAVELIGCQQQENMILTCGSESQCIPISQILYFESVRHVIIAHYGNGKETFEFYSTLNKMEECMADKGFVRVHRSYLVSMRHAVNLTNYVLKLDDGEELPVGKGNYKEMKYKINHQLMINENERAEAICAR
jgi:DNA-binding LytR/AlgR family response regulator